MCRITWLCFLVVLTVTMVPRAFAGRVELTTYYPAPYGDYEHLKSTDGEFKRLKSTEDSYFATDSGNVGIGTTSPGTKLEIRRDFKKGNNEMLALRNDDQTAGNSQMICFRGKLNGVAPLQSVISHVMQSHDLQTYSTRMDFNLDDFEGAKIPLSLSSSGKVGIGTTMPYASLQVVSVSKARPNASFSTSDFLFHQSGSVFEIDFSAETGNTSTSLSARSDGGLSWNDLILQSAGGNVGIGVSSPTYKLQLDGQPAANGYTAWTNYSDGRLKENIKTLGEGTLEKVMKLNPSTFQYNDKYYQVTGYSRATEKRPLCGFVAQEMEKVFPDMVGTKKIAGEDYLETNLTNLQVYLVKAMQEQQAEIETLKKEIAELKKK